MMNGERTEKVIGRTSNTLERRNHAEFLTGGASTCQHHNTCVRFPVRSCTISQVRKDRILRFLFLSEIGEYVTSSPEMHQHGNNIVRSFVSR